ncbi:putative PPM-type phosphatase, divalent cation binding, PPM-type phosphatase domain superfamily [Helianthus annuus]|uniref:PPM-type phosphatase, divalent cation binding, PPM-type phosphatase domain superfamily n=1 Tax=Helianthus annuus TaxID=4232 RepID=A0A9K3DGV7_HELAN|nr:putative PPM-type phosphatase, divalent cation binding, PPM-type phosphatase domain superfamily [Helianthus annuus]KAJ0428345.1 putative PPM-type phosphatase, divalent cation binding, PPM-type phosphatase domain superfamily [Helianthus annuus]KAJ0797272.1 putative PPM-type phosphatase, divalent cation binding, PPM-type phosphatase domain superfamily [Helianthus annuus]KAJ0812191.1 putative PPM-type phosphatase, divalent cation binding, PPM-type phosphatase domain superfamily [Helianthus annuu
MFLLTVFTLFYETKKKVSLDAFMLVFRLDFWLCIVHVAVAYLDPTTSFFGVYDGHGGKVAAKFCTRSSLTSGRTKRILLVILKHLYKRCLPEWMKLNEGFIWFPRGPTSELLDV